MPTAVAGLRDATACAILGLARRAALASRLTHAPEAVLGREPADPPVAAHAAAALLAELGGAMPENGKGEGNKKRRKKKKNKRKAKSEEPDVNTEGRSCSMAIPDIGFSTTALPSSMGDSLGGAPADNEEDEEDEEEDAAAVADPDVAAGGRRSPTGIPDVGFSTTAPPPAAGGLDPEAVVEEDDLGAPVVAEEAAEEARPQDDLEHMAPDEGAAQNGQGQVPIFKLGNDLPDIGHSTRSPTMWGEQVGGAGVPDDAPAVEDHVAGGDVDSLATEHEADTDPDMPPGGEDEDSAVLGTAFVDSEALPSSEDEYLESVLDAAFPEEAARTEDADSTAGQGNSVGKAGATSGVNEEGAISLGDADAAYGLEDSLEASATDPEQQNDPFDGHARGATAPTPSADQDTDAERSADSADSAAAREPHALFGARWSVSFDSAGSAAEAAGSSETTTDHGEDDDVLKDMQENDTAFWTLQRRQLFEQGQRSPSRSGLDASGGFDASGGSMDDSLARATEAWLEEAAEAPSPPPPPPKAATREPLASAGRVKRSDTASPSVLRPEFVGELPFHRFQSRMLRPSYAGMSTEQRIDAIVEVVCSQAFQLLWDTTRPCIQTLKDADIPGVEADLHRQWMQLRPWMPRQFRGPTPLQEFQCNRIVRESVQKFADSHHRFTECRYPFVMLWRTLLGSDPRDRTTKQHEHSGYRLPRSRTFPNL